MRYQCESRLLPQQAAHADIYIQHNHLWYIRILFWVCRAVVYVFASGLAIVGESHGKNLYQALTSVRRHNRSS